ncbi:hypothetical protein CR513_41106, partial [Mucuna pruriens]
MKPEILSTLSFLLFAFTTNLPLVLDTNGNPIPPARRYYIFPAIWKASVAQGPMLSGIFCIQKYGFLSNSYKLVFCPDHSSTCSDIGTYDNNEGGKRLVLTQDSPLIVVFENAYKPDATINMKDALLITLSLFALSSNLPLGFSQGGQQVRNIYGKPIFSGGRYYVEPSIFGPTGGGVGLDTTDNSTCPVTVLQDYSEIASGMVVKFTIPESTGTISMGIPLDISFEDKPWCATSSKWVLVADNFPAKWVGIGGAQDHPGKEIITGKFNIQKANVGYKLVFCDTAGTCTNIARYEEDKGRRLILSNAGMPFEISFVNALP